MNDKQSAQITALEDIFEAGRSLGKRSFAWGGFGVDLLAGRITRAHGDIDMFTEDLSDIFEPFAQALSSMGYAVRAIREIGMLVAANDRTSATFNEVKNLDGVACWRHIGQHGAVHFPWAWLDRPPRTLLGARAYPADARLLYAVKTHPELLGPAWKGRDKDKADIEILRALLSSRDRSETARVWSFNPYWYAKGHAEYYYPLRCPAEV